MAFIFFLLFFREGLLCLSHHWLMIILIKRSVIIIKAYIAGKITGLDNYKELFNAKESELIAKGYKVMNPSILPDGFEHGEYMKICYAMIDVCDEIHFLDNWTQSIGARMEYEYGIANGKVMVF